MCLYPKLIKNKKYQANKKNGGIIPVMKDGRTKYIPVGCTNCLECRKQKARGWQVRLLEDIKTNKNGKFITLTFSDEAILKYSKEFEDNLEGYDLDNRIATRAVRLFLERWRKKYKTSLRHWLVTELGHDGTENIHLHGIVWCDDIKEVERIWNSGVDENNKPMRNGYVWMGKEYRGKIINYVNERTVNYIIKYVTKTDEKHQYYKSKVLTSKGIGSNYTTTGDHKINKYKGKETQEAYRTRTGHKIAMPTYWRNKIYTEEEREKLWLNRLDKEERYILGVRVDVRNGHQEYYKGLEVAREKNRRLGYGNDEKNWTQEQYERERRRMNMEKRKERARTRLINASPAGSNQKGLDYMDVIS